MMKRQFRLIGLVALVVLSACNSKSKGPTDTYSSGVVSIAADESFEPIIQEEIEVFESLYPLAINLMFTGFPDYGIYILSHSRALIHVSHKRFF